MNSRDQKIPEIKEKNKSFLDINQQVFTELLTFVDFADEKLNIGFVEVNFAQDRDILIKELIEHQDCQNIQFEVLTFPNPDLRFLRDELVAALKDIQISPNKKLVLLITGLEKSIGVLEEYPSILTNLNFVRDDLRHSVDHPMLLFLPEYALTRLAKYAPDFWAWRRKVFSFKNVISTLDTARERTVFLSQNTNSLALPDKQERIDLLLGILSEYNSSDKQENKHSLLTILNIYNQLGTTYYSIGKYQQSINFSQQSLQIARKIGERNGEANSLNNLGSMYYSLGEYQQSIDYLQQSLVIKQQIGDRNGEAKSLGNLGSVYYSLGEYQRAIDYLQQSLVIKQQIGDLYGEASSLNNLGSVYYSLGEYQQAIDYLQQSLKIFQQTGDRNGEANSLGNLGNFYYLLGEYQRAIDYLQQSLEIFQQIGDRNGKAIAWFNLGNNWIKLHQKSQATTAFKNSKKLYQAMGLDKQVEDCDQAIQNLDLD